MDALQSVVTSAVQSGNHARLASVFSSEWTSLGQGEQRSLAAHFVKSAVSSPSFLPGAFRNPPAVEAVHAALKMLPPTVEGAADNVLRQKMFDFLLNDEEDYVAAARVLSTMRMEAEEGSPYYMPPQERCDVFVKVAECYLEEDMTVEAEGAVTKAGHIIEAAGITMADEGAVTLLLRYKSTYARVLDANRKFLQAAMRYHDLSTAYLHTDAIDADDLLSMLGRAVTCAILSPNSAQRQRVLGLVYKDERLAQLDAVPEFQSHSAVLTKMYLNRIVQKRELEQFESSLADHQKALMADGLTIVERGVLEHNMVAVSQLYASIYFSQLGELLGVVDGAKAERVAAKMIGDGSLSGSIDEVEGVLRFHPTKAKEESAMLHWDETITSFCVQLNKVTDAVR
ncbi:hypothetical protein ACHAXT_006148 [Thalassiosira profunda]